MQTIRFGFGSTAQDTHLDIRLSVVKNAIAAAGPAVLCLIVTACAFLQPYSVEGKWGHHLRNAATDGSSDNSDACMVGDLGCVMRESAFQANQAGFLARQYPRILKSAQILESSRERFRNNSLPHEKARLEELAVEMQVMTRVYNTHAAHTDPALLSADHLPTKLVP